MSLQDLLDVVPSGSEEQALLRAIDFARLPRHVAIIMDGNGRWAKLRHKRRVEGHRAGIAAVRDTVETSARLGLAGAHPLRLLGRELEAAQDRGVAPSWASSSTTCACELDTLLRNNIRFHVIGRPRGPAQGRPGRAAARDGEDGHQRRPRSSTSPSTTAAGPRSPTPCGGSSWTSWPTAGDPQTIDEQALSSYLYTAGQPDPDLLIRTSGELRISNFLLWQIAYAEIWVTEVLWPDFRRRHLLQAIADYQKRERRYGGIDPA